MENSKSKLLLVIGCQRSGTTLLAAMLGRHSEINMLFESTSNEVLKLMGKQYSGNKLLAWRQIQMNRRASKFGHLINRVRNLHFANKKHHKTRPYPTSKLCVQDYIDKDASLITIVRDKEEVVESITTRTEMTKTQAENEYNHSMSLIEEIGGRAYQVRFSDLVHHPTKTLTGICNFLKLDFENRMFEGVEYNFVYPNSSIVKEKSKTR